ncbi:MAG TPA: FHA domain-containing protein [Anaerolineae bacterium]|nr:FHA domain-containing protein [Anaerolineae bacterium]
MDLGILLFGLRLVGAALLLLFVGSMGWVLYADLQTGIEATDEVVMRGGHLLVVDSDIETLVAGDTSVLAAVTMVGRAGHNHLVLAADYVSTEHAVLQWREQCWWLDDLDSRNGTLLNGGAVTKPTVVQGGDVIQIGGVQLQLILY